jgi:hypothetical protein
MPLLIELNQELGSAELDVHYDSNKACFKLCLKDTSGDVSVADEVTIDQLDEFMFKLKRILYLARYEEVLEDEDEEDEDDE